MKTQLIEDLKNLNIKLSDEKIDQLLDYLNLLEKWNKTYNLTAIRDKRQMLTQHIVDSLAILPSINSFFTKEKELKIIDVGSGGGLPGAVLAICNPQWQLICVDAVEKKTSFINFASGALGLKNLKAEHTRIEDRVSYEADLIVSRAFASLSDFISLSANHVKETGVFLAMKGIYPEQEITELPPQWEIIQTNLLKVPRLDAQRCLIWLKKTKVKE